MSGTLYLVATPIGNLNDISPRALSTLEQADFIAAEDTRVSLKLMNHFALKKPLLSYHEHNHISAGEQILQRLLAGESCALVTDAGTPAISDPGGRHCASVRPTRRAGGVHSRMLCADFRSGRVRPVHGPVHLRRVPVRQPPRTAGTPCLPESGAAHYDFYEAPHKLLGTLNDLVETFGAERRVSLSGK